MYLLCWTEVESVDLVREKWKEFESFAEIITFLEGKNILGEIVIFDPEAHESRFSLPFDESQYYLPRRGVYRMSCYFS